jgi:hypothetical protein
MMGWLMTFDEHTTAISLDRSNLKSYILKPMQETQGCGCQGVYGFKRCIDVDLNKKRDRVNNRLMVLKNLSI